MTSPDPASTAAIGTRAWRLVQHLLAGQVLRQRPADRIPAVVVTQPRRHFGTWLRRLRSSSRSSVGLLADSCARTANAAGHSRSPAAGLDLDLYEAAMPLLGTCLERFDIVRSGGNAWALLVGELAKAQVVTLRPAVSQCAAAVASRAFQQHRQCERQDQNHARMRPHEASASNRLATSTSSPSTTTVSPDHRADSGIRTHVRNGSCQ